MSSKKAKEIQKEKHTKRNIIILVASLVIVLVAITSFSLINKGKEKESTSSESQIVINELFLELGNEIPVSTDFSRDLTGYEVILDDEIISNIYLKDNSELNEEAYNKLSDEEKNSYTAKKILLKLGTFDVILKRDNKEYRTKLTIQDTLAPKLTLKEVTITEGDELNIDSFIESCTDNSRVACTYSYVDDENNETDTIDVSVGERTVSIIAKDESGNKNTESTKLVINKKVEEKPTTNTNKNNTTTNNNSNKTNTSSNNSSNNSSNISENSTGGNETTTPNTCEPMNNTPVYMKANCIERNSAEDKANQTKMSSAELSNKILYGSNYNSPARTELNKCDTYFRNLNGDTNSYCADFTTAPIVVYSTDGRIYGYGVKFTMKYAEAGSSSYNKVAAEGYVKSDDTISYTTKNIPY